MTPPLHNWAGNVTYSSTQLHRPRTVEQLQELVSRSSRIRPLGTGHCFNRLADTTGEFVSVRDLGSGIRIEPDTRTVGVWGGLKYAEVADQLHASGFGLHNLGSLPHISVAGACSTATHGSGNRNGNLATAVVGMEMVRADGELLDLNWENSPGRLAGSVVGLGALGVVTRLTLAIEPAFELRQDVWLDLPLATLVNQFDAITSAGYSVSLFTDWSRPDVIDKLWIKRRPGTDIETQTWGAPPSTSAQHPIKGLDPAAVTDQLGVPGPWHDRLPHFRKDFVPSSGDELQSEYLLPRDHAPAALTALREIAERLVGPVQVCEIRTVAADSLWLSPSYLRDSVAVHFTWVNNVEVVLPSITAVETALSPFDPRPHWGKLFVSPPEQVTTSYERLPAFRALANELDPERKFGNAFLEDYIYGDHL